MSTSALDLIESAKKSIERARVEIGALSTKPRNLHDQSGFETACHNPADRRCLAFSVVNIDDAVAEIDFAIAALNGEAFT